MELMEGIMKAEDTERILKEWAKRPSPELGSLIRISFKAGYELALQEIADEDAYESIKQAGIKEVVELLGQPEELHIEDSKFPIYVIFTIGYAEWQAQKKKWGIDES